MHPYFWDPGRRLEFLQEASDYFESLRRDDSKPDSILTKLERDATDILGGSDWSSKLDGNLLKSPRNRRPAYDGTKLQDLLRLIRNKVRVQP